MTSALGVTPTHGEWASMSKKTAPVSRTERSTSESTSMRASSGGGFCSPGRLLARAKDAGSRDSDAPPYLSGRIERIVAPEPEADAERRFQISANLPMRRIVVGYHMQIH